MAIDAGIKIKVTKLITNKLKTIKNLFDFIAILLLIIKQLK